MKPEKIQLYSASTPNGLKAAIALEELVALRQLTDGFDYEAHSVDLRHSESRRPGFLGICPNGKIPAIVDPDGAGPGRPITVWESGSILTYLAEKFGELMPGMESKALRAETMNWMFWGCTGVSSQFKHFGFYFKYCVHKLPYCVSRYANECHRLLFVLEQQLGHHKHWVVGDVYTVADIAIWPWVHALHANFDNAAETIFDNFKDYPRVKTWYRRCLHRPAIQKALQVTPFLV